MNMHSISFFRADLMLGSALRTSHPYNGTIINPILQMGKLEHREIKKQDLKLLSGRIRIQTKSVYISSQPP